MIGKAVKFAASSVFALALVSAIAPARLYAPARVDVGNPHFPWMIEGILPDTTPPIEEPEGRNLDVEAPSETRYGANKWRS